MNQQNTLFLFQKHFHPYLSVNPIPHNEDHNNALLIHTIFPSNIQYGAIMKNLTCMAAIILACFLLLTGCSKSTETQTAASASANTTSSDFKANDQLDAEYVYVDTEDDIKAEALFQEAEEISQTCLAIRLNNVPAGIDDEQYIQELQRKGDCVSRAVAIYYTIITQLNSVKWGIASTVQAGILYEDMSDCLRERPVPETLAPDVQKEYAELVEQASTVFMIKAVSFYRKAVDKAEEHHFQSEYVTKARQRLSANP